MLRHVSPEAPRTQKRDKNQPDGSQTRFPPAASLVFERKSAPREVPGGPQRGLKSAKKRIKKKVVFQKVFERRFYRFLNDFRSPPDLKNVVFVWKVLQTSLKSVFLCWLCFLAFCC